MELYKFQTPKHSTQSVTECTRWWVATCMCTNEFHGDSSWKGSRVSVSFQLRVKLERLLPHQVAPLSRAELSALEVEVEIEFLLARENGWVLAVKVFHKVGVPQCVRRRQPL